ncbi:transposase [Puniceicoccus vermicola]|uniref:transposase n=1 Tax=Puniceicoccus vermicola TaxID=388746 RepID=UPI001639DD5A|nr:transposase [Puniceicoccus vermicola]
MARPLRVEYAGGCYHVLNRGNYRQRIFSGKGAAEAFERVLGEAAERFGWRVHAYVIMSNHFHLAVELGEPNLSEGMKWLQGTWIRRFNRFRNWTGRPFQGRYKGIVVEPGHVFAQVCHYIHLNPVRAGIVSAENLGEYRWSSFFRLEKRERPGWLEFSTVLSESGGLGDNRTGWNRYQDYLVWLAEDEFEKKKLAEAQMSRGWCKGSKEFRKAMRDEAKAKGAQLDRVRFEGLEPKALKEERMMVWEEKLVQAATVAGIDLGALPRPKMSREKCLLAAVMKKRTSVSNRWLAERLGTGSMSTPTQAAKRANENPGVRKEIERIAETLE